MAPEVLNHQPYNPFCADTYSLGVILFIVATDFEPDQSVDSTTDQMSGTNNPAYSVLRTHGVRDCLSATASRACMCDSC